MFTSVFTVAESGISLRSTGGALNLTPEIYHSLPLTIYRPLYVRYLVPSPNKLICLLGSWLRGIIDLLVVCLNHF